MRPIIIDCDPGQDDAINLFLAFAARDQLDILGITAVAGNVGLNKTERNTRILCELAGQTDIPVYAGCDAPLEVPLATAEEVHGREGLDGVEIYTPKMPLQGGHAVNYIIQTLRAAEDKITLVPTGPLTNIARALTEAPDIKEKIDEIVLMGGAMREGGNITPSAEFNIYVDPLAAKIVFDSALPIVAFGLDVTHQVLTSKDIIARVKAIGNPVSEAAHGIMRDYSRFDSDKYGTDGGPLHDPCTVAYLLRPDLFKTKTCNLSVEISSELTRGHTAVDFWHVTDRPRNTKWAYEADRDGFFDLLVEQLSKF